MLSETCDAALARLDLPPLQAAEMCIICLESLQASQATVITLQCGHSFHVDCFRGCSDVTCPVCRYAPSLARPNRCEQCDVTQGLWMCLGCGFVGCGREQWLGGGESIRSNSHALLHSQRTGHLYAQNLTTQRVWDYGQDSYCSHLGMDGAKLASLPFQRPGELSSIDAGESLALEYTHLLTQQLDAQRLVYVRQLDDVECARRQRLEELRRKHSTLEARRAKLAEDLSLVNQQLATAERDFAKMNAETTRVKALISDERLLLDSMRGNQSDWSALYVRATAEHTEAVAVRQRMMKGLEEKVQELMGRL